MVIASGKWFSLSDGFGYKDRYDTFGSALVFLIRRVGFHSDVPQVFPLGGIRYLANPHSMNFSLVANLNVGFSFQVEVSLGMFRRAVL
jgi:hypothetical protein